MQCLLDLEVIVGRQYCNCLAEIDIGEIVFRYACIDKLVPNGISIFFLIYLSDDCYRANSGVSPGSIDDNRSI